MTEMIKACKIYRNSYLTRGTCIYSPFSPEPNSTREALYHLNYVTARLKTFGSFPSTQIHLPREINH